MAPVASPDLDLQDSELLAPETSRPWQTIVWDDPVNLMSYVVRVFRDYFGFSAEKANELMLKVHNEGRAIVSQGAREQMEMHAQAMHSYGLWATVSQADA